ncbi:MAG: nucleotidyltransferase domain-containing protein [Methanospirillum sp.]|nr:nucleotidyltransferase domain-containing protein [Methanospirillum sp.]
MNDIITRIVTAVNPDKIILFGSHAKGNPTRESDIDILVVMNSELPRHKRSIPLYRVLMDIPISKDIIVYTPEEIASWSGVSSAFITSAIQSGIILYDKNSA